jgi:hypothetical protein
MHRGQFKGSSYPSYIQGENDHDLALVRDLIPLSAPWSIVEREEVDGLDWVEPAFL